MQIIEEIKALAKQYETADFLVGDPSWFMHQVSGEENQEAMAFVASCFSFGSRKQFMKKLQFLLDYSGGEMHHWIKDGLFLDFIPDNDDCFYRIYTNSHVRQTFLRLQQMYKEYGSMKGFILSAICPAGQTDALTAISLIVEYFKDSGGIIPKNTTSSCKRLCMFVRWMVRDGSPVDLGLWPRIIDKSTLIMPMDTHVMQQSRRLTLLEAKTPSMSAALKLTARLAEIFPKDPLKADFALFGYGVSTAAGDKNK